MTSLVERLRQRAGDDFALGIGSNDIMEEAADSLEKLLKAVRSFELADTELRRADLTREQPRLQKAGNRYAAARYRMFTTAKAIASEKRDDD